MRSPSTRHLTRYLTRYWALVRGLRASALLSWALALLLLGAAQCDQESVVELDSAMRVSPDSIDFGLAAISQDSVAWIEIANPAALDLQVEVSLAEDSDPAFRLPDPPQIVVAGKTLAFQVLFRPQLPNQVTGRVLLRSDSKQDPSAQVVLLGTGEDRGLPQLQVDPEIVDFGAVGMGEVERAVIHLRNVGVRDLVLDEVLLDSATAGAFVQATTAPVGFVLRPDDAVDLQVIFAPPNLGEFTGVLRVRSNDPARPEVPVLLSGAGHEAPIAVLRTLDPNDDLQPMDSVRLDASESFSPSPDVEIVRYLWQLSVRPQGSTTLLRSADEGAAVSLETTSPRTDLLLDLAGRYEVLLDVIDARGLQSTVPAVLRLRAVPDEDLHVQLVWDHPTADLDLHYLRGRLGLFDHDRDCYFSNRYPDWYVDDPDANPRLDVDDQGGFGPENVNVLRPHAGTISLQVHYWDSRTSGDPSCTAMLRLYVRGQLAGEFVHQFADDELMWDAVELQWPDSLDGQVLLSPIDTVEVFRRPF